MQNKTLKPQSALGYGSVYLDSGEDVEAVTKKQIETFREQLPKFVFFDVVCKKDQIDMALAARGYVEQELHYEPGLDFVSVYVAITFDDKKRPARDAMMEYLEK